MADRQFENYLLDPGTLIKEKALAAKSAKDQSGHDYDVGYLMAWHEVVSLMQTQAVAFEIDVAAIGLEGIDPATDLL